MGVGKAPDCEASVTNPQRTGNASELGCCNVVIQCEHLRKLWRLLPWTGLQNIKMTWSFRIWVCVSRWSKGKQRRSFEKKKKKGANTFYIESVWTAQSGISKSYSLKAEVHSTFQQQVKFSLTNKGSRVTGDTPALSVVKVALISKRECVPHQCASSLIWLCQLMNHSGVFTFLKYIMFCLRSS